VSKAYSAKNIVAIDVADARLEFAATFGAMGVFKSPQ
jgi:Zn-dependent alcohol dehydrogenase